MKIIIPFVPKKYQFQFWTALAMFVWILFFDGSNLIAQFKLWQKYRDYEAQKQYYAEQIKQVERERQEVLGNPKAMEKFAREKYLMKKEGESVFVILDKGNKSVETPNSGD
jgi:cell division protein DivIC